MKVLLLHPLDVANAGPWSGQPWDRIVDLGLGGENTYCRWRERFQCPIQTMGSLRNGFESFRQVRDLLGLGCGRLIDAHGLDWWEIMSILLHEEMEALLLLKRFVQTLRQEDELHISRAGVHATLLQGLVGKPVEIFSARRDPKRIGLGHYLRVFKKLTMSQMSDVIWDRYDAGYQFRGRTKKKRQPSSQPVVLLPTAYVNVSRTGVAYANTFPQENFLMVATRRSGWLKGLPRNVKSAWLSSYASLRNRNSENREIEIRWQSLLDEFRKIPEYEILIRLGYLDSFPTRFRHGLEVRDAWRNVLDREPVEAVLCADDSNPYTRIPLLLARARGLPNVACHHGALDGRYVFKRSYGDVIWVKGKMEEDYLVRKCGVPEQRVEIAAPALPLNWRNFKNSADQEFKPNILFFSEASDVSGGRPKEFYRDILPPLADLALNSGHKLIIKLHPAESRRERERVIALTLNPEQRRATQIVSGPLTEELLTNTWFGITILSTVAVECAVRGIPCFLCKWLEFWPYEYIEQFTRFGVGFGLSHPSEISRIPEYLEHQPKIDAQANCWQPATPGRLRQFITARQGTLSATG